MGVCVCVYAQMLPARKADDALVSTIHHHSPLTTT